MPSRRYEQPVFRHFSNKKLAKRKEKMAIGAEIHAARSHAGLTQAQLAKRVGTTQSVISDLEDAEFQGHTMSMLRRVANALGFDVEVRLAVRSPSPKLGMAHS
jgi:transcriptional regulator with XRE-family HTH domain